MANIFTDAVNFIGTTLKQAVTPDTMRDYQHANRLYVGSNYKFVPKTGFLFHVYFDVNTALADQAISGRNPNIELGLMVKNVDLPRFNIATKTYNAYNRPNVIQSKIGYEPVSISFHDDNFNLVRTFWQDYYNFYYRDSDHKLERLNQYYKYTNKSNFANFGYTPRGSSRNASNEYTQSNKNDVHYLKCIRIYSLHQKKFSEYCLVNPIIKTFRHGQHQQASTDFLQHDMVVEYENIIYNSGSVGTEVRGFAELHYDKSVSPLKQYGRVRSIFGSGGLLDTAGSVLQDIDSGNYGAAIFNAARGINMARSMNIKSAAISEITGIVTQNATAAIQQQINQNLKGTATGPINVPTVGTVPGSTNSIFAGPNNITSTAALAGAAILLNSTPITNRYKRLPTEIAPQPSNYNPKLPQLSTAPTVINDPADLTIINDQKEQKQLSDVTSINDLTQKLNLDKKISQLADQRNLIAGELQDARNQVTNTTQSIAAYNNKLSTTQALPAITPAEQAAKSSIIAETTAQIQQLTQLKTLAEQSVINKTQELNAIKQSLDSANKERAGLGP